MARRPAAVVEIIIVAAFTIFNTAFSRLCSAAADAGCFPQLGADIYRA